MNLKKSTRKRNIKKGGAFTGNQIHNLFRTFSSTFDNDFTKLSIRNINPLDINNIDLYNNVCHVFYINDSNKIRFVILHRGTITTSVRDWINNLRNLSGIGLGNGAFNDALLSTQRKLIAKRGHQALKEYLIKLYNNRSELNDNNKTPIINMLNNLMNSNESQIQPIHIEDAVDELLLNTLTTLGHSQGSVYAYLYGNQGKETIVINPAPYKGTKPDNTYVVRRKFDPVSMLTRNVPSNRLITLPSNSTTHSTSTLKNLSNVFGNKYLYNHDSNRKNTLFNSVFVDDAANNPLFQSSARRSNSKDSSKSSSSRNSTSSKIGKTGEPTEKKPKKGLLSGITSGISGMFKRSASTEKKRPDKKEFLSKFGFNRSRKNSDKLHLLTSEGSK
jgi:hypothetical protein